MPKWLKTVLIVLGVGTAGLIVYLFPVIVMLISVMTAKVEVYDDIASYENYLAYADRDGKNKWSKWDMDESIWPRKITDSMKVSDYKMVYYNPWDAQYLGYLVVEYTPEEYAAETARLRAYPSDDYIGIYSVTEEKIHELLAIHADPYQGFVYALAGDENQIIYAEQIFCNYMMDLDYKQYIPEDYLLDGFNAGKDNPYRKKMMNEK
ncbi:MAG: hypothetical protein IKP86_10225 [Anaerolineaceae bacterium]|nr:hypothetical protein [Anaerolineaceae bacterium]